MKVGDQVAAGGSSAGTVKKIVGNSAVVQLEGCTITLPIDRLRVIA